MYLARFGGAWFRFEQPSDIIAKVAQWYPDELAAVRKAGGFWPHRIHLHRPDGNATEHAAFVALWRCMPRGAWLYPQAHPFAKRWNESHLLRPFEGEWALDLGPCLRHQGYQTDGAASEGTTVASLLRDKFAALLARQRCRGVGPDDCVLILRLWASLWPTDPGLAAALQRLEPEVAPEGTLPAYRHPDAKAARTNFGEDNERYAAAMRHAAFLRAKLQSVLEAPSHWPSDALPVTLRQMSGLRERLIGGHYVYELDDRNEPINPWRVLGDLPKRDERVDSAILAELQRLASDAPTDCAVVHQWLTHGGSAVRVRHALAQWRDAPGREPSCVLIESGSGTRGADDLQWLAQQTSSSERSVLYGYLAAMGEFPEPTRAWVRDGLTNGGQACRATAPRPDWLAQLCEQRVSSKKTR